MYRHVHPTMYIGIYVHHREHATRNTPHSPFPPPSPPPHGGLTLTEPAREGAIRRDQEHVHGATDHAGLGDLIKEQKNAGTYIISCHMSFLRSLPEESRGSQSLRGGKGALQNIFKFMSFERSTALALAI